MKEPKKNQEDIVKEVLPVKEEVIKDVLDVERPVQVEVDATQAVQAQPEKPKKKTGVIIATVCISLIIVFALVGVAAI